MWIAVRQREVQHRFAAVEGKEGGYKSGYEQIVV